MHKLFKILNIANSFSIDKKPFYLFMIISFFLLYSNVVKGQNATDTVEFEHSPRKASIYSTVLPGLGQAYNEKYWKIPIIYAGIGVSTYLAIDNNNEFNRFRDAYIQRADGEQDEFAGILNEQALINEMDRWRKMRDYSIIGIAVIYILQIVDANVDANLYNFDVSDDLSLRFEPSIIQNSMVIQPKPSMDVKLVLRF